MFAECDTLAGNSLANTFILLMVAAIIGFQVAIPIIQDAVASLTGTTKTIADILPVAFALVLLVATFAMIR